MEQRRAVMQTWADYLDKLRMGAEVIQLKKPLEMPAQRAMCKIHI